MSCKLFISHATSDVDKVTPIVDCITSCFELSNEEIMYTSSLTKGVRNGKDFNNELREAIQESELVIVFLSANYLKSQYCLIELGATWGNNKKHFIIKENNDISFHELSIFSTTTQDNLSVASIAKLREILEIDLKLPQKLTSFLEIFEQCEKAANKISNLIPRKDETKSHYAEQGNTSSENIIETDGLKIFREHHATFSEKIKQAKSSIRFLGQINTSYSVGSGAFQIIEQQYKNIKHFLKQYTTKNEDIKHLEHQSLGKFGDFYTAFHLFIKNIDYLGSWYQIHQDFHNDYEFCVSEYNIEKNETNKNLIEENASERLAAILYIIKNKCSKISLFDKKGCELFLSNRENKIIATIISSDTSNGIKPILQNLFKQENT